MIRALALLVFLQSGCIFFDGTVSPESACINLCDCLEATPTAQEACAADCTANVIDETVPQECLDCVGTSSCEELEDLTTACAAECQGAAARIVEE